MQRNGLLIEVQAPAGRGCGGAGARRAHEWRGARPEGGSVGASIRAPFLAEAADSEARSSRLLGPVLDTDWAGERAPGVEALNQMLQTFFQEIEVILAEVRRQDRIRTVVILTGLLLFVRTVQHSDVHPRTRVMVNTFEYCLDNL